MTSEEDKIFASFPECPLAPLQGVPTYAYMTDVNVYLNACSSSINCSLGCGTLGYLVLTAQPSVFTTHNGNIDFVVPTHPGVHPDIPTPAPTAAVINTLTREHKEKLRLFNEYHAVDKACKRIVQKLIPQKFYKSLASRIIGFAKISCLTILTHLITEYAELEDEDLQVIDRKMKEPITGETLFEEFVEQIEWNQEAVSVQNPYTPKQIVSMAFANVENSGYYADDCREWLRKPTSAKDWAGFKTHFARAFKEVRKSSSRTARSEGYAAHVQRDMEAAETNAVMFAELQQSHTDALANLATATASDRASVATLTQTIAELSAQVASLTAQLATASQTIVTLSNQPQRNRRQESNQAGGNDRYNQNLDPNGYCSTHGYKVKRGHSSRTCNTRGPNHNVAATRLDTKNGCQLNKAWAQGGPTE